MVDGSTLFSDLRLVLEAERARLDERIEAIAMAELALARVRDVFGMEDAPRGAREAPGRAIGVSVGRRADLLWAGPSAELEAATRRTDEAGRPSAGQPFDGLADEPGPVRLPAEPDGPAASGAKPLASTGWPGATNAPYIGAVAPGAETGLGAVGIPPGTPVGP